MNTAPDYVTIAVVGVLATCVGGLLWIIKFMFNKTVPIVDKLAMATAANTRATKSADKYLRDRNGRDSERHQELLTGIHAIVQKLEDTEIIRVENSDKVAKILATNTQKAADAVAGVAETAAEVDKRMRSNK